MLLCSLLVVVPVAAQPMATVQRPCSSVASPADLAPLDTLPPGTRLAVNVTLDIHVETPKGLSDTEWKALKGNAEQLGFSQFEPM
ncbi:MAG: hypothetical protein LCH53_12955 [Bacteroidetes bacterium]|nr:hypothetical protein [Bacteroidota bacterium]